VQQYSTAGFFLRGTAQKFKFSVENVMQKKKKNVLQQCSIQRELHFTSRIRLYVINKQ